MLDGGEEPLCFCKVGRRARGEGIFQFLEQGFPLGEDFLRRGSGVLTDGTCACEGPFLELGLRLLVGQRRVGSMVPEGDLGVGGEVACSADNLHIAYEAAVGVAVAAVVHIGGIEEEAASVEYLLFALLFRCFGLFEVILEGAARTTKGIERNNAIHKEAGWKISFARKPIAWSSLRIDYC